MSSIGLTPHQQQFIRSPARFRAFVGGRGAGKSYVGAIDLLVNAVPGDLCLVAAPTYPMLRDATLRTFVEVADRLEVPVRVRRADMTAEAGGVEYLFRSADNPDRLRGPNLARAWLDEGSVMVRDALDVVLAALRQGGRTGYLTVTFTPRGLLHWTYEKFGGPTPPPDTEVVHSPTRDNPFLPADFADVIARQYGEGTALADQELEGRFVNSEGAAWPAHYFERPDLWCDAWPETVCRVVALDPAVGTDIKKGCYHAAVAVGARRDGHLFVDADVFRDSLPAAIVRSVGFAKGIRPHAFVAEENIAPALLVGELRRAAAVQQLTCQFIPLKNYAPKDKRIQRLGGYLAGGQMHFRRTPGAQLLVRQLRQWPNGAEDDGPDSLEMAVRWVEENVTRG